MNTALLCFSLSYHGVTSRATVSFNQKPVLICLVCHLKNSVQSVADVAIKVFQVNPHSAITNGSQTIVVSNPELSVQIPKPVFVGFPAKIKVNRAVQTSLKNCLTSTICGHVTQHFNWFSATWTGGVNATRCETIINWLPEHSYPVFNKLTRHEPAIQPKNQHLVSGQLQKTLELDELST